MSHPDEQYHEGSERQGVFTLIGLILGLLVVGLLMFTLTWAVVT